MTIFIEAADVASMIPALAKDLRFLFRVFVIALADIRSANDDFAFSTAMNFRSVSSRMRISTPQRGLPDDPGLRNTSSGRSSVTPPNLVEA